MSSSPLFEIFSVVARFGVPGAGRGAAAFAEGFELVYFAVDAWDGFGVDEGVLLPLFGVSTRRVLLELIARDAWW